MMIPHKGETATRETKEDLDADSEAGIIHRSHEIIFVKRNTQLMNELN